MRGVPDPQLAMLTSLSTEDLIPVDHPIRKIRVVVDAVLAELGPVFDAMYAAGGRRSVPPEQLLKASVLMAMYSIRSERAFCERLNYDRLFKWFLDMRIDQPAFDATTFSKNRKRLLEHEVATSSSPPWSVRCDQGPQRPRSAPLARRPPDRVAGPHRRRHRRRFRGLPHRCRPPPPARHRGAGPLPRHPPRQPDHRRLRRRVQQHTLGRRGHNDDPLYRIRRLPLVGHDHFDPKGWARLPAALAADDLEGEVAAACLATELSREVHAADDVGQARRRLLEFFFVQHCAAADVPELRRLASTIERWSDAMIAYHATGLSHSWSHRARLRPIHSGATAVTRPTRTAPTSAR